MLTTEAWGFEFEFQNPHKTGPTAASMAPDLLSQDERLRQENLQKLKGQLVWYALPWNRRPCRKHWGGGRKQELTIKDVCWPPHACPGTHISPLIFTQEHAYRSSLDMKQQFSIHLAWRDFLNYIFKRNTIVSIPPTSPSQLPYHLWYTFHGIHHRDLVKGLGTSRRKGRKGCKSQNTRKSVGKNLS